MTEAEGELLLFLAHRLREHYVLIGSNWRKTLTELIRKVEQEDVEK